MRANYQVANGLDILIGGWDDRMRRIVLCLEGGRSVPLSLQH